VVSVGDSLQQQIVTLLCIPLHLTARSGNTDVQVSYMKYVEYLKAKSTMLAMVSAGMWTLPSFTSDKLIEVFVSKSTWHAKYSKLFPQVRSYPQLVAWLDGSRDAPSNFDLFGIEKQSYTFKDLEDILGKLKMEKLKRKGRESGVGGSKKEKRIASGKGKQAM